MNEIFDYLEEHKTTAIILIVALLVLFGVFCQWKPSLTASSGTNRRPGFVGNGEDPAMRLAALQTNTLTLPMGVVLEGKGTVISVEPGSPAERAGIQPGDLINRINGR
ncbi:MAG: PDZ domain-containing protein [Candidatus Omnitrophica bacterium]|nr:PDZ domain-containing protein [Candidatus Omnitrophota bacterium]